MNERRLSGPRWSQIGASPVVDQVRKEKEIMVALVGRRAWGFRATKMADIHTHLVQRWSGWKNPRSVSVRQCWEA